MVCYRGALEAGKPMPKQRMNLRNEKYRTTHPSVHGDLKTAFEEVGRTLPIYIPAPPMASSLLARHP